MVTRAEAAYAINALRYQAGTMGDTTWTQAKSDRLIQQVVSGQTTLGQIQSNVVARLGSYTPGSSVTDSARESVRLAINAQEQASAAYRAGKPAKAKKADEEDEFDAESAATIKNLLRQYGLEEMIPLVDSWVRRGMSWAEIEGQLMDPTTDAGRVVDRIYPELRLRREAKAAPMSITQIQQYRTQARQMFRAAGLPEGFYDNVDDFRNFIVNDVSLSELSERVERGYVAMASAPPEVRAELERMYGVGPGDLVAFFLDEKKALPLIQRRVAAAQISGAGVRTGFGSLSTAEAEGLAAQGVDEGQAQQGLGDLAAAQELFRPLNQTEDTISRQEQLGAAFSNDAAAKKRIERRQRGRTAAFEGGGRLATSRGGGMAGLSTTGE